MRYTRTEIVDGIAVLWLDQEGERQNTLSTGMFDEFEESLERLETDPEIIGAVLISGKDDFIAGADINMLLAMTEPGEAYELSRNGQKLLARIRNCKKPIVAAIHGACLGGGLEVVLNCHARIVSDDPKTVLGLPEVQLGLLPGGTGTQLLPRLVGIEKALPMMLTGKRIFARPAVKMGLADAMIYRGGLLDAGIDAVRSLVAGKTVGKKRKPTMMQRTMKTAPARSFALRQARKMVARQTRGNYPATTKILDAVEVGLKKGLEAGLEAESKGFDELAISSESKSLIFLFQEMTARKKNPMKEHTRPIKTVGVLGAGLMGAGVAHVTAKKGTRVVLKDISWGAIGRGIKHINDDLAKKVRRRIMRPTERDKLLARIDTTLDYESIDQSDVVIEAVFENLDLKRRVLADTEAAVREDCIFASNTSALPIADIAAESKRPETVIGMHYFSPVEKMPLLEIITTDKTADWVTATCIDLGITQGKTVIVVGDGPGFYTSRILGPYMNEAMLMLEEGAGIKELDNALKDFGFPVGPVALLDEVGIDVAAHVSRNMGKEIAKGRKTKMSTLAERMVEAGFEGRKNRKGFYLYPRKKRKGGKPVNQEAYKVIGASKTSFGKLDMAHRLTLPMVNEAVRCLEEGVLACARDGDVGAVFGLGFPPFHAGPFHFVDHFGVDKSVAAMEKLAKKHGPRFEACELLNKMAQNGERFYP